MKKSGFRLAALAFFAAAIVLTSGLASAQGVGPSDARTKEAFKMILSSADTNKDGKLSLQECNAIWKDKKMAEKNCRYWDANGDGTITEDEYVKQSKKRMK
jgi:Ca2+-binding EF-hand superfamily protein